VCHFFEQACTLPDETSLKAGVLHVNDGAVTVMPNVRYHQSPAGPFGIFSLNIDCHYRWWRRICDRRYANKISKRMETLLEIYRQNGALGW
jgi:hypothetical protein